MVNPWTRLCHCLDVVRPPVHIKSEPALRCRGTMLWGCVIVAEIAKMPADQLEPVQRVRLLGSLILLSLGGISLIFLAWLTLRVGRRSSRREDDKWRGRRDKASLDDWAARPLADALDRDENED